MPKKSSEHTLEFLLSFNGHVHRYAGGYWLKFEITKVEANDVIPFKVVEVTEGDNP